MMFIIREALAVAITAYRAGMDPKSEIGFGYDGEHNCMAIYLHRQGHSVVRVQVKIDIPNDSISQIILEWASLFRSLVEDGSEVRMQEIFSDSDFSNGAYRKLIYKLVSEGIVGMRCFKHKGDTHWRCAACYRQMDFPVEQKPLNDYCGDCRIALVNTNIFLRPING